MSFQLHLCGMEGGGALLSPQSARKKAFRTLSAGPSPEKYNYKQRNTQPTPHSGCDSDNVPFSIFLKVPLNYNSALDNESDI